MFSAIQMEANMHRLGHKSNIYKTNSTTLIHLYAIHEGYYSSYFLKISQLHKLSWNR